MKKIWMILGMIFFVSGCAVQGPSLFGGSEKKLTLSDLDEGCKNALPKTLKGSFGQVKILAAVTQSGDEANPLSVTARFVMTSFEIPEGIEGIVRYNGTLRYDPATHTLYFTNLQPISLTFGGNRSLLEYVSPAARRGLPPLVAQALESIPVYRMEETFGAKSLQSVKVDKENLLLEFR
ncbi:MAG TPA: DUF1439 domain-containing protein [Nitratifractor salsuginis]|uniref:DUF1439 domain-containing protein n=1 Tax=Nitratifractor salsuginis TaxID=269261 RepID=A0A7V2SJ02_9BACT|nr:DUF1439 domain-containing protein [Nitratifractor salsuginis]